MEENVEAFLYHAGVKGMKWGVRTTRKVQKQLDLAKKVRDGKASKFERTKYVALGGAVTKKGAGRQVARGKKIQSAALANTGKAKAINILMLSGGVRIKELNYD